MVLLCYAMLCYAKHQPDIVYRLTNAQASHTVCNAIRSASRTSVLVSEPDPEAKGSDELVVKKTFEVEKS